MKRRKSIIVETAGVFGARAVFFVVGLISSIIINRTLGAEGRGVFAILLLYPDLLFMLFSFGMGEASAFNIGKKVFSDERVFAGIITASLVAGAVVLLFGAGLYELLRVAQFKGIGFGMFMFSLARMPLYFFFRFMDYFFIGRTEIGRRNALIVVQITSYLVFIVLFLLTGRLNVFGAVATVNLSYLVVCLYGQERSAGVRRGGGSSGRKCEIRAQATVGFDSYMGCYVRELFHDQILSRFGSCGVVRGGVRGHQHGVDVPGSCGVDRFCEEFGSE